MKKIQNIYFIEYSFEILEQINIQTAFKAVIFK